MVKIPLASLIQSTYDTPQYRYSPSCHFPGLLGQPCSCIRPADFLPKFANQAQKFEPGEKLEYNDNGFILLGLLLEIISGKPSKTFPLPLDIRLPCATIDIYINTPPKAMTEKSSLAEADRDARAVD
jgi:hypothetical protein